MVILSSIWNCFDFAYNISSVVMVEILNGAKAHKGWLYLKADGEEKIYYLNKEGLLESGKWVKIKGKWYYFYSDGTLAVNTQIDGYEVDRKGVRKKK